MTHVSQHWREVAVNCGLLWRWPQVLGVRPEWTNLMLVRSKKSSIFLRAQLYTPSAHALEACLLVLAQIRRLGEIHLSGDGRSIGMLLNSVEDGAPRLKSLILSNSGWKADAETPALEKSFLQEGAPTLERLELRKCALPWDAPLLKSCFKLQTLVVDGLESNRASLPQFLGILRHVSHLRVLRLENIVPAAQGLFEHDDDTSLPDLEELYLSGPTSDITALLANVIFPPPTSLSLRCTCSERPDELPLLRDALSAHLNTPHSALPPRSLHISLDAVQITVHANATERIVENESLWDVAARGSVSVTLVAGPDTLHTPAVFGTLVHAFALQDVRALLLDDYEGFLDELLVGDLLRKTPNLQTVHARHDAASPVVTALMLDGVSPRPERAEMLLPRLETLILEEVDMNWSFDDTPFMQALQQAQYLRCLHGCPVDELRVKRCMNVGQGDIRTLCHLFAEVDWDAFEAYVTDADSENDSGEAWPDDGVWTGYWEYEAYGWHS